MKFTIYGPISITHPYILYTPSSASMMYIYIHSTFIYNIKSVFANAKSITCSQRLQYLMAQAMMKYNAFLIVT